MRCPRCGEPSSPKSTKGYCKTCAQLARAAWRETVLRSKEKREAREVRFAEVYAEARQLGYRAGQTVETTLMRVVDTQSPKCWDVPEGPCGFAWVNVSPGNCAFANWLKAQGLARRSYSGGVDIWISEFGQSVQRKEAMARTMAEVLREKLGVKACSDSRLD